MLEIKDLAFRFYEPPIVELFNEIGSSSFTRIEAPEGVAKRLEQQLNAVAPFCTMEWDSNHPILYRARRHCYGQLKKFVPSKMGPPQAHMASAGRAQPEGVAVLYLADSAQTAIAEVKPGVKDYVTTGIFRIKPKDNKSLKVLDLTQIASEILIHSGIELSNLLNLSRRAFSAPVSLDDPRGYYAQAYFVQMLRAFRHDNAGYDGIGYESAVNPSGRCFAFFDADNFRCTQTSLHQVQSVSIVSEPVKLSSIEKKYITKRDEERQMAKKC